MPFSGVFSADVTVGNQTLRAALDTGSSDTWILTKGANCTALATLQPVTQDECGYAGPRYDPGASFEPIPNVHFNDSYGTGETINGPLGYSEMRLGGLTVPKQEISAATYASVGGVPVGNVSGLLGLAYPNATAAYPGTDPSKDVICPTANNASCGPIRYTPLISTIFEDHLSKPLFAFAISRSTTRGGVMTIGGIPRLHNPQVNATEGVVATVPIQPLANTSVFVYYYVGINNFQYTGASPNAGQGQYLVDTGTSVNTFPSREAKAINALFDPPAVFEPSIGAGYYIVQCNATAPQLGITIGGQTFYHNPQDLIIPAPGVGDGRCWSAVQGSLATLVLPILGFTFLKNVLAVFDVGNTEMTFMSRMYYEDS